MQGSQATEAENLYRRVHGGDLRAWVDLQDHQWARLLALLLERAFPRAGREDLHVQVEEVLEDLYLERERFVTSREAWSWAYKSARLRVLDGLVKSRRLSLSLSLSPVGSQSLKSSLNPRISHDGNNVVFTSTADVGFGVQQFAQVYLASRYEITGNFSITLISTNGCGQPAAENCRELQGPVSLR